MEKFVPIKETVSVIFI